MRQEFSRRDVLGVGGGAGRLALVRARILVYFHAKTGLVHEKRAGEERAVELVIAVF